MKYEDYCHSKYTQYNIEYRELDSDYTPNLFAVNLMENSYNNDISNKIAVKEWEKRVIQVFEKNSETT